MINYIDYENSLIDVINDIESFEIFDNGTKNKIKKESKEFEYLLSKIENLFFSSRLMPAFGVSLHQETMQELKNDIWLKINFRIEQNKNGLSFDALLFKLEEVQGFNLIREYKGKYEGRCIYLDLERETDLNDIVKL